MSVGDTQAKPFTLQHLTSFGLIEVSGKDAERFLQGQISANVAHATAQFAPYGVFCTPRGRVLANVQLIRQEQDCYWLLSHVSAQDLLLAHLKKYAVFFKATLEKKAIQVYGLMGDTTAISRLLETNALPHLPNEVLFLDERIVIHAPGEARWLLLQQAPITDEAALQHSSDSAWWQQEIQQGVAWLDDTQSDKWLPQMLNWEALGGISFKKGCYTGQEVVARAHYRGQVKKRIARYTAPAHNTIQPGDSVLDRQTAKSVGTVINAQPGSDHIELLAVVNLSEETRQLIVNDIVLKEEVLPYTLERVDPEALLAKVEEARV